MFCTHCGGKLENNEKVCPYCGQPVEGAEVNNEIVSNEASYNIDPYNNNEIYNNNGVYNNGVNNNAPYSNVPSNNGAYNNEIMRPGKSKVVAGILGILLGTFGIHNFYLGYIGKAVAQLLITVLSCGILFPISGIWGFIEGILILVGTISVDGHGNPLVD